MNVAGLQFTDRPQQLRQRASQPVEARDAQAVAGPRMIDQPSQPRPVGGPRDNIGEDADSAGILQPVMLPSGVLVGGGDARVAEDVARPSNDGFADGFGNSIACLRGLPDLPKCRSPSVEGCVPPAVGIAPALFIARRHPKRRVHGHHGHSEPSPLHRQGAHGHLLARASWARRQQPERKAMQMKKRNCCRERDTGATICTDPAQQRRSSNTV